MADRGLPAIGHAAEGDHRPCRASRGAAREQRLVRELARRAEPAAGRRARRPRRIGYQADLDFAPPSEAWQYLTTRRRFLLIWQSALVRIVDVDRSPSDMSTAGCAVRRAGGMSRGSRVLRLRDSTRTSTPRTRVSETAGREFRSQTPRSAHTTRLRRDWAPGAGVRGGRGWRLRPSAVRSRLYGHGTVTWLDKEYTDGM
jgi:hypothetical protein